MFLQKLQEWNRRSLSNSFALQASIIAIAGGFWIAIISLSVLYWSQYINLQKQTQGKLIRSIDSIERMISVAESVSEGLAHSSIITTGILDSSGRNAYLDPFLKTFKLPTRTANGIVLCDINGERLSGTRAGLSDCHSNSQLFKQVLIDGKTVREVVRLKNAHLIWTVYQAVALNYTGSVEGVLVTQLDLNDLINPFPKEFELNKLTIQQTNIRENIISAEIEN